MRSIKTYGDAGVDKVAAVYSMALKPDLNSARRRVMGYATRRRVRNLTKSAVAAVAWDCAGHKAERKREAVKRDFYRHKTGRAQQSESACSITQLKTNSAAPGC